MIPYEEEEQSAFVEYLELKGLKYTAIPNSTYTKSRNQKRKNTLMWLRRGFPDLVVIVNNSFIAIEMKRRKWGVLSPEQKKWIETLNSCNWVYAYVTRWCKEAVEIINKHLYENNWE